MTDSKQQANQVPAAPPLQFSPSTQIPAALLVLGGFVAVAEWKPELAWQALLAAALAGVFLHIHLLKSFKLSMSGVEAELREAVNQAYATIDGMREVAAVVIHAGLLELSWGRLAGGVRSKDQHELRDSYVRLITKLELRNNAIDAALDDFHRLQARELLYAMLHRNQQVPRLDSERAQQLDELHKAALHVLPAPDRVRQVLGAAIDRDPEQHELLQDYEHYLQHHQHCRPEKHW